MVRTKTRTIEIEEDVVIADQVDENIHFNDETVAIFGRFDTDEYTADIDTFESSLVAIEQGADRVDINDSISLERMPDAPGSGYRRTMHVEYKNSFRASSVEELQAALDQARNL